MKEARETGEPGGGCHDTSGKDESREGRKGKKREGRKKKECASKLREKEHASARKRKKGKEVVVCTESVGSL